MNNYRYGLCCGPDKIAESAKVGAKYVELSFGGISKMSNEEVAECKRVAEANGIACEAANCMMPGELKIVGENVDYKKITEYLDSTSAKANELGIKVVVLGSSGARNVPDGFSRETAREQLVTFLKDYVSPAFKKYGLICALENLSFSESNILNMLDETYSLAVDSGCDNINILVDFYHFGKNNDSEASLIAAKDKIKHVHMASVLNNRYFPAVGDGEDYGKIIELLQKIGYDGRISFEAGTPQGKTYGECAKESIELFKNL